VNDLQFDFSVFVLVIIMYRVANKFLIHWLLILFFSIRSKLLSRFLSKLIGGNGFSSLYDIFIPSSHQKQTKRTNDEHYNSNARLNPGSSALSSVPGCSECFLGLQVSNEKLWW
jgi:hypothetical protein